MQIKKIVSTLYLFLCLSLIGVSAWFLFTPIEVSADDACITVNCNRGTLSCCGSTCTGSDQIGCSCTSGSGSGQQQDNKNCRRADDELELQ